MDLLERLKDAINTIDGIPIKAKLGYADGVESVAMFVLPNSRKVTEYYDGACDVVLNVEIVVKSKDGAKADSCLWLISGFLDELTELVSKNSSFEFNGIEVANKPYVQRIDEQGWVYFALDVEVSVTKYKKG